jgi:hypothetical protein
LIKIENTGINGDEGITAGSRKLKCQADRVR